jgi:hypothetical protein
MQARAGSGKGGLMATNVPYQSNTAAGVHLEQGEAPAGGAVFSLNIKAGESALVSFPATVSLVQGETGRQFLVTWVSAGTTTVQAQLTELGGSPVTGTIYEEDFYAMPARRFGDVLGVAPTGEARICRPEPVQCEVV